MDLELESHHALVTGSTAGIGFAIALGLAREGAQVTLNGRTQAAVDAALARLRQEVPRAGADGLAADCATAPGAEHVFHPMTAKSPVAHIVCCWAFTASRPVIASLLQWRNARRAQCSSASRWCCVHQRCALAARGGMTGAR